MTAFRLAPAVAEAFPDTLIVFLMPAASMRAAARTNTTSAMPRAVARVVVFRTTRLRRL